MPNTPETNLEKLFEYIYSKRADKAEAREPAASVVAVGQLGLLTSKEQESRKIIDYQKLEKFLKLLALVMLLN